MTHIHEIKTLAVAQRDLKEKIDLMRDAVSGGAAKDFSDYQRMCGEIRGLTQAYNNLIDLVRHLEQDDA